MKSDIILSGVGGQGILSIAAAIGMAAIERGLKLKQAEVHGMSQRGGAVQSHLRVSDWEIASDLIPLGAADLIISVEPMEALRYLPYLSKNAWIITNISPFVNIPDYPEHEEILKEIRKIKNHVIIDADQIAKDLKSPRSSNMVILGAASQYIDIPEEYFLKGISQIFGRKGEEIVTINKKAFMLGKQASMEYSF
jgi:indolepyruvate ferredoxin oxidoreductase, beta subunit